MTSAARANTHHIAVGLCILLLGVLLILDRLGIVGAEQTLRYWPVGLIIIGASVILQAFRGDNTTAKTSVPWGAIFWLLILGFGLTHVVERRAAARHTDGAHNISIFAMIGGERRTAAADVTGADITTVMGGVQLDLRNLKPQPGEEIVIEIFNLMGGSVIYAPPDWSLDTRAVAIMGGISDHRRRPGRYQGVDTGGPPPLPSQEEAVEALDGRQPGPPPRLVIRGYVAMGGVAIKSM